MLGMYVEPIRRPPSKLLFCHIPKTGSSFEASVRMHGGTVYGEVAHEPIAANASDDELGRFAVIFREPEMRLMSMYWWLRQHQVHCCPPREFGWNGGSEWYHVITRIGRGFPPQDVLGNFTGCQLNMLMGHRCCSRHVYADPIEAVVRAAQARIDRLFFVGLTSEWFLSVCLFS